MKATTISIYFFLFLLNINCTVNDWDVNQYKNQFEIHKKQFEILIQQLKDQNLRVGYAVKDNELPDSIKNLLKDLDISAVIVNTPRTQSCFEYQFTSTWSSKATLYFSKDNCNKEQTTKGYHANVSEMIEVWGLGDDWTMWIDHDFI